MTTPPLRRARWLLLAALAILVVGCGGQPGSQEDGESDRPTYRVPVEEAGEETEDVDKDADKEGDSAQEGDGTVQRPDEPEPDVDLTGPPAEVWPEIQRYDTWLNRHPDPEKAGRTNHPRCECHDNAVKLLTHYAENNQWWAGGEIKVLDVETLWIAEDQTRAKVRVVDERVSESKLIDATGKVHDSVKPGKATTEYGLAREGRDEPWRVLTFERVEER